MLFQFESNIGNDVNENPLSIIITKEDTTLLTSIGQTPSYIYTSHLTLQNTGKIIDFVASNNSFLQKSLVIERNYIDKQFRNSS